MNVRSEEFGLSFDSSEFLPISPLDLAFVVFEFFICLFSKVERIYLAKESFLMFSLKVCFIGSTERHFSKIQKGQMLR